MTDFADFKSQIADWANRADWSDALVTSFVRQAEQKLNAELRVDRMIQFDEALIRLALRASCPTTGCRWTSSRIANDNGADGFLPIRYKARDEFYNLRDNWTYGYYTIEGRQIYVGPAVPTRSTGKRSRSPITAKSPSSPTPRRAGSTRKYPNLYLDAALMHAALHAVSEQSAANFKQLTEDQINKLNAIHLRAKASEARASPVQEQGASRLDDLPIRCGAAEQSGCDHSDNRRRERHAEGLLEAEPANCAAG